MLLCVVGGVRGRVFRYLPTVPEVPFTLDFDASTRVLTVAGDVDEPQSAALREGIEQHSEWFSQALVVDLTSVTYLPSAAVGVLAKAGQSFAETGATLELAAATGSIAERVLTVCAMPHRTY